MERQRDGDIGSFRALRRVYELKIFATVTLWCIPLIAQPPSLMAALGMTTPLESMLLRLLATAYLALCVGYAIGYREAGRGVLLLPPIWVGLVSNGGACSLLIFHGVTGTWDPLPGAVQSVLWLSALGTAVITLGLWLFGLRGRPRRLTVLDTP